MWFINIHGITVHGLAHHDIVVVIVARDLLESASGTGLELSDGLGGGLLLLKLLEDLLDVGLQVRSEVLLGGLKTILLLQPHETELVLNVVDHGGLALTTLLLGILSGRVGTLESEVLVLALKVLAAVGLEKNRAVLSGGNLEGGGAELISGNNVL